MSLNKDFQNNAFEIECRDRWVVFRRLRELEISCSCSYYQPLTVKVHTAGTAIQVWSVLRQIKASRSILVNYLENCWQHDGILHEES
jgi:hypothetical protein